VGGFLLIVLYAFMLRHLFSSGNDLLTQISLLVLNQHDLLVRDSVELLTVAVSSLA